MLVVIALGGAALLGREDHRSTEGQRKAVHAAAEIDYDATVSSLQRLLTILDDDGGADGVPS